jgi:hypothetical protein
MFHLHLVHCITHLNCFLVCFMVHWTKFLIAKVVCNCLRFVKLFHLFTDLPLNGSHTYLGPSSLFWTLLDIISCLYKLLIYSLNSILQNWSCSHLLLHYQPIIKFQTFISTPWSFLAFWSFILIHLELGNSLCISPINLTALAWCSTNSFLSRRMDWCNSHFEHLFFSNSCSNTIAWDHRSSLNNQLQVLSFNWQVSNFNSRYDSLLFLSLCFINSRSD